MKSIIGIIVSILFVVLFLGISTLLEKKNRLSSEGTRKLIHIGVSNWWFIAMYFFESGLIAAIVPSIFVVVNYVSYKKQLISGMERDGDVKDLGTVYYAISLLILAVWTFNINRPEIGAVGILVMGYADGLAAVIGVKYGKIRILGRKTLEGTLTTFVVAFIVIFLLTSGFDISLTVFQILIISLAATVLELVTPLGLDNLSVPMVTALITFWMDR